MVRDTTVYHPSPGGGSQTGILSFTYNQIGLTQNISNNGSLLAKYLYLADGTGHGIFVVLLVHGQVFLVRVDVALLAISCLHQFIFGKKGEKIYICNSC